MRSANDLARAEQREIEAAANWAKAREGLKALKLLGFTIAAAVSLSFAYFTGEHAGLIACHKESTK
jgi:alpha/beta superfamily hydrolase